MTFEELNKLTKYCDNRINLDRFIVFMTPIYQDERYITDLWPQFSKNPIRFITSRGETELFNSIINKIEETSYKG